MGWGRKGGQFGSKGEAMARAKKTHCCLACLHNQPTIFKTCPSCGVKGMREYFPSRTEHLRAVALIHAQKRGEISGLQFHERFPLIVEGVELCKYEADACYVKDGSKIVEDTKPGGGSEFIEELSHLKIALFNALYAKEGLRVTIYRP